MSFKNNILVGGTCVVLTYSVTSYAFYHKAVFTHKILRSAVLKVCNENQCVDLERSQSLPETFNRKAPLGVEYALNNKEVMCLAQNIYFEARGESYEGQIKIGLSTVNRVKDNRFPSTICGVVNQSAYSHRSRKEVHQMSWRADRSKHDTSPPKKFIKMAKGILAGNHNDICKATNWFNPKKSTPPRWSAARKSVTVHFNQRMINKNRTTCVEQVGKHIFLAYK